MKRLPSLFDNTLCLLVVLALVIPAVLLAGGQIRAGLGSQELLFQSLLSTPRSTPTPTPLPSAKDLKVVDIEPVKNGPYRNILWSPDGKKALVGKPYIQSFATGQHDTGLDDLWLLDLATGAERRLAEKVRCYAWSSDSTQVAYLALTGAEGIAGALYVLDIASGRRKWMAHVDFWGRDYAPHWLPTGEIVYVRDGRLWAIRADGSQKKVLSGFRSYNPRAAGAGKPGYLHDPDALVGFHFSPDGKRVAYKTHRQSYRAISYRIWLADADGSNAKLVTEQAEGSYYEWSPDSQWLVFDTYRDVDDPTMDQHDPGLSGLWVVRADGSDIHPLYRADFWHWILSPAWSPDSSMVVFVDFLIVAKPDSPQGVFRQGSLQVADVKRGETTPLKGLPENEEMPGRVWWSPDGKHLFIFKHGGRPESYQSYRLTLATE